MPYPKPQHRSLSAGTSPPSEPQTQFQHHLRVSSSPSSSSSSTSRPAVSLSSHAKRRGAHAHDPHGLSSSSQPREMGSLSRSSRSQRNDTERIGRAFTTEQRLFPPLRTKDILSSPRLQQVTGLLPSKVDLWADRELPPDELYRLAWAMTLPEPFPMKRPRGEIRTPIASKVKKT
ncbi:hypothetical protein GGR55DRAFT_309229 [Xylaria sp. FL0064]|nr:hypothetical protein GGR55DRAFT_309229 [Xylaria sp. FL0064]